MRQNSFSAAIAVLNHGKYILSNILLFDKTQLSSAMWLCLSNYMCYCDDKLDRVTAGSTAVMLKCPYNITQLTNFKATLQLRSMEYSVASKSLRRSYFGIACLVEVTSPLKLTSD